MRALEIRVEHTFFEFRIANAPAKLVREHRTLSSGIYHDFRIKLLTRAVLHLHFDADRLIAFKEHLLDQNTLMHHGALFGRMIDQQVIELRPRDLPGDGTLVMDGLEEVERARLLARRVCKLHAVLPHEWT